MNDLMTPDEDKAAALQGWSLEHVYDMEADRWRVMVLGMPSAEAAGEAVVNRARMGDTLAQKALSLIMKSNQGT
jgi:hypothetical protein